MSSDLVLAAIDDSTAAAPVLAVADGMASVLRASLGAVHVQEGDDQTAATAAEGRGVPLRVVEGDPVAEIVRAAGDPDVVLVVVGARGRPTGPRPVGHVAIAVVEQVDKPVLVVPPGVVVPSDGLAIRRALIPLEGTREGSRAVADTMRCLCRAGTEVIALHVFDAATAPRFWDEPGHAEQSWADEFVSRWCHHHPTDVDLRLRRGAVPATIVDIATTEHVDLIALSWSRDLAPGHAAVVRGALTNAEVPVLLIPTDDRA